MGVHKERMARMAWIPLLICPLVFAIGCEDREAGQLRLLTYNIHHGVDDDGGFNLDGVIETIRRSGADVVALQEVDRVWSGRSAYFDQARHLADSLGMDFAFGATLDREPSLGGFGEYGIMILSRFPIAESLFHLLPADLEQRGVLYSVIQTPYGRVPVACTHLGLSASEREQQITDMLTWLPVDDNLVLMGDFNTPSGSDELVPLRERFFDLQGASGQGDVGTYFHEGNWVRIDYIFAAPNWRPDYCVVLPDRSSDHLAVSAGVQYVPLARNPADYRELLSRIMPGSFERR